MATFSGNAAGYRVGLLDGKIRVVDIDFSDGDTGTQIILGDDALVFADKTYQMAGMKEVPVKSAMAGAITGTSLWNPVVAGLSDESYVIAWHIYGAADSYDIYLQRYDADGNAVGDMKRVTEVQTYEPNHIITALADGGWLITWQAYGKDHFFPSYGVYTQRYDAAGNAVGGETLVNTTTLGAQENPAVTALSDGGYVVAWETDQNDDSGGIFAQRYDATGNKVGGEAHVNTQTANYQGFPAVAFLDDGGYVIAWQSRGQDGGGMGIYAQRYDAAGNTVGGETRVNTYTANDQSRCAVTGLANGGFVVTWHSAGQDGGGLGVYAQCYDASGNAVGGETRVNTYTAKAQAYPVITALSGGGYVIAWESDNQGGIGDGFYVQRYDSVGNAVGGETRVNTLESVGSPAVAALSDGGFIVSWKGRDDNSGLNAIFSRRFDANGESVLQGLVLTGTDGADVLNGGAGAHFLRGKLGDDILNGGAGADNLEGDTGNDTLNGGEGSDHLWGSYGHDVLNGGQGNDFLFAELGNDTLNGGAGDDHLDGYGGNDALHGADGNDYLVGHSGKDVLYGDAGDDQLLGLYDEDRLYGGEGNDTLIDVGDGNSNELFGGEGNDVLVCGNGDDTLRGGDGNDSLDGGEASDALYGNRGDDILDGGSSSAEFVDLVDTLIGGVGHDTYVLRNADIVVEEAGAGIDTVLAGVSYVLAANVEKLTLTGTGAINGTGNSLNNVIAGNSGNNILDGGTGRDSLIGDGGSDKFGFTTALNAATNTDTIADFLSADGDVIVLSRTIFSMLDAGVLDAGHFAVNANGVALDGDDYIVHETDTGALYYDADGSGVAISRVKFAVVGSTTHPTLTAADFEVI